MKFLFLTEAGCIFILMDTWLVKSVEWQINHKFEIQLRDFKKTEKLANEDVTLKALNTGWVIMRTTK